MEWLSSIEQYIGWLEQALRTTTAESDQQLSFQFEDVERQVAMDVQELESVVARLHTMEVVNETAIACDGFLEMLVKEESAYPGRFLARLRDDSLACEDADTGIRYELSRPSDEYLLFLLEATAALGNPRWLVGSAARLIERGPTLLDPMSPFDLLRRLVSRLLTVKVSSERQKSTADLRRCANSFLFELSYNLDIAVVPQTQIEDLLRTGRIARVRRAKLDEIDPPRRLYNADLIHHYQLAVGSDSAPLQYLSYYHIAEHYFESVFNDDLIDAVQQKITLPGFSYRRKRDVQSLIGEISKRLHFRRENVVINEQEALRLTLLRFVDAGALAESLSDYDEALLVYYRDEVVPFSGGGVVDLRNDERHDIPKALASRIHRTRNAIVHAKESERERYIPFTHDRALAKEIPLIRFVAEQIIVEASSLM